MTAKIYHAYVDESLTEKWQASRVWSVNAIIYGESSQMGTLKQAVPRRKYLAKWQQDHFDADAAVSALVSCFRMIASGELKLMVIFARKVNLEDRFEIHPGKFGKMIAAAKILETLKTIEAQEFKMQFLMDGWLENPVNVTKKTFLKSYPDNDSLVEFAGNTNFRSRIKMISDMMAGFMAWYLDGAFEKHICRNFIRDIEGLKIEGIKTSIARNIIKLINESMAYEFSLNPATFVREFSEYQFDNPQYGDWNDISPIRLVELIPDKLS